VRRRLDGVSKKRWTRFARPRSGEVRRRLDGVSKKRRAGSAGPRSGE
jgi:hypothetical protein